MKRENSLIKHIDFLFLDLLSLVFSFVLAYYIRQNKLNFYSYELYREMLFIMMIIEIAIFFICNPYKGVIKRGYLIEFEKTLKYDLLSLLISVLYLFIVKSSARYSRIVLFLTYLFYFVFSYVIRVIWKEHIKKEKNKDINKRSLFVICKKKDAETAVINLSNSNFDYFISGICIIDENLVNKKICGMKIVANKENVLDYISTNWIDEIFIFGNYNSISKKIIENILITGLPVRFKIDKFDTIYGKKQIVESFASFNTLVISNVTHDESSIFVKRAFDILLSIFGSIITVVLAIIIGPIIYIKSPGPIIYVSKRVGKNGKVFKFYKFRSMINNAEIYKKDLANKNRSKDGLMFKIENDPRIIPGIGNFIRKTSLDEFPQFFNVLKGDMSLVGTRPPTLDEWEKYTPYYRSRLSIKPGITGLWQTSGRSNITDFNEVVKLDNEYINNWSLSLDIKIIFKTAIQMFSKKNSGSM